MIGGTIFTKCCLKQVFLPSGSLVSDELFSGHQIRYGADAMADHPSSENWRIRRSLGVALPTDADLSAFCIDHFPHIHRQFADGMNRMQKENLLLAGVESIAILTALRSISEYPTMLGSGLDEGGNAESSDSRRRTSAAGSVDSTALCSMALAAAPLFELPPPRAPFDPRFYVARGREELRARDGLKYRLPIVLHGPELYGKTWLLHSILRSAIPASLSAVAINLSVFGQSAFATFDGFLRKLALRLCRELRLPVVDDVEASFDRAQLRGGPLDALYDVLEWNILPATPRGLIIALDNVDLIAGLPYQDEFYGMLRAWIDNGQSPFDRLRFVLCVSTAPALLVEDPNRSPFNIGVRLSVSDFDDRQIENLAQQYDIDLTESDLAQTKALIGGHPYLLRTLLYESRRQEKMVSTLLSEAETGGGVFVSHLRHLRLQLERQPDLLAALADVEKKGRFQSSRLAEQRLEASGLILRESSNRKLTLRHRLYRHLVSHD